ncbi:uncharacterized protein cubi_00669 [Cryptosporidium ubiquitum]|uniref:Uncharacterized protein n=1 Tax=Cryptosporidium ubiquitum TaxID=857276 RepID=A0A1J4MG70_9CRYT|nr:uncharacterized protein cubi_00669 [Cryptosporidium ubiquitum]OII71861.1 hypothetical protein cubi_00669 [Cryptosporidium ubiquitum]
MKIVKFFALFLAFICYQKEQLNVQAANAIKKLAKKGGKSQNSEAETESSGVTLPKNERCKFIGNHIAEGKNTSKYLHKFMKCLLENKNIQSRSIHEKYTKISEKCARYGHKASELTKISSLDCIFCYKEIVKSMEEKFSDIKKMLKPGEDESIMYIYTIVAYLEKYLRAKLSVITRYVTITDWFMAYSSSRDFCGTLVIVYGYWNRVVRDVFWTYLIVVSDNYLSRFPVEFQCPYSRIDISGVNINEDKDLTAIMENPLSFV